MAGDLEIGQLQEGIKNLVSSVDEIKEYLGNGIARHTEVMSKLAVISSKQQDFSEYQKQCESDRLDLSNRISVTEKFQKGQIKIAAGVGGLMAFLAYGGAKFVEKVAGWFS